MTPKLNPLLRALEAYLGQYVTFATPTTDVFVVALWIIGTYLWPHFDAFPYLVITSHTKRSGKTRLSEVVGFAASNPRPFTAATAGAIFALIRDEKPTVILDEAEFAAGATAARRRADVFSQLVNSGYRLGSTIPRRAGTKVVEYETYCPKVFVLIGDVFDTLQDRSIVIRLQRGEPRSRFLYHVAKAEGNELGVQVKQAVEAGLTDITAAYTREGAGLDFLMDRDEEIWLSLFAICEVLAPERLPELRRIAVDLATEKTQEAKRYVNLMGAERAAEDDEYAKRLLRDLATVLDGKPCIFTAAALVALKALETAPWRKYRGEGLSHTDMANLLSRFGVAPRPIKTRTGPKRPHGTGGRTPTVARGYRRVDVEQAVRKL